MRFLRLLMSCAAASATLFSGAALAQDKADAYPSKPFVFVVPVAVGGPNDLEARLYAAKMSGLTGQQFIVDNKPGAGTRIGTAYVAKAKPDGYTLLVVTGNFTTIPALHKDLPFDTIRDFAPVSLMSKRPLVLFSYPSFPAKTFGEYIAYAKANPGKINFGTTGVGGISHLLGSWMHSATNTKVTFIPYKGTGPMLPDLFAGRVDVHVTILPYTLPLIKSGKVRPLAITDDKRSKLLPDLPTVAEQGIPGYNYASWHGYAAPGATPAATVTKLSEGFARVAKAPDVAGPSEAEGHVMVGSTAAQFRQLIVTETDRWRKVVQDAGIRLEE